MLYTPAHTRKTRGLIDPPKIIISGFIIHITDKPIYNDGEFSPRSIYKTKV